MLILGLDLGRTIGYTVMDSHTEKLIVSGSDKLGNKVSVGVMRRLQVKLVSLLSEFGIEKVYYEQVVQHHKSGKSAEAFGGYKYSMLLTCLEYHIPVVPLPVGTIKKVFTGSGNATKDEVEAWCLKRYNIIPLDNNEADAIAIAFTGIQQIKGE